MLHHHSNNLPLQDYILNFNGVEAMVISFFFHLFAH